MPNQFRKQRFPSIPEPDTSPNGLYSTVKALKRAVEELTTEQFSSDDSKQLDRHANHCFVQATTPTTMREGDMWLALGSPDTTFNVFNGTKWLVVGTIQPVP